MQNSLTSELHDAYDLTPPHNQRPSVALHSRQRPSVRPKNSLETTRSKQNSVSGGLKPPVNEHDGASSGDDSLLDLYRANAGSPNMSNGTNNAASVPQGTSRKRVASRERSKVRRKGSKGAASTIDIPVAENEDSESKWIHRDKLAQIESREMAEMGVRMGRPSRANSHAKSARTAKSSVDVQEPTQEESNEDDSAIRESRKLQEAVDEEVKEHQIQQTADSFASHVSQRSEDRSIPTRPSTSRIPVPTSTPASYEEDSPLEMRHKRSGSFGYQKQRTRSRSEGSQHLLDNAQENANGVNGQSIPTSPQISPQTERNVSKGAASNRRPSAQRKPSGTQTRSRASSATDPSKRPGTSGGSRPPTARPEGEAPWIATMFKPDPRLPPDQQMLPTHAKRMAQLQAEAEAKSARDAEQSEFQLMDSDESKENKKPTPPPEMSQIEADAVGVVQATNGTAGNRLSVQDKRSSVQQKRSSTHDQRENTQWPLRTPSGHEIQHGGRRISPQSAVEHGGYNLMPTLNPTQSEQDRHHSLQKRSSQRSHTLGTSTEQERRDNAALAPVNQPVRLHPEDEQAQQKKKGCACCVVM